jgi:membrane-bound serine protease (ClpP class)
MAVLAAAAVLGATIVPNRPPETLNLDAPQYVRPAPPADARTRNNGWFAARSVSGRPALPREVTKAFIIPIREEISPTLYKVLVRKAVRARNEGAQLVVFDMDTPGGRLDAMTSITQLILDGELRDIYTVVYVNPNAFSAGAMISLACNEITVAPSGVIGDAMPIMVGPNGIVEIPEAERIKVESGARALVRATAARNDYSAAIADAMVTIVKRLWLIRNAETGELRVIDPEDHEWQGQVRGTPKANLPAVAQPKASIVAGPVTATQPAPADSAAVTADAADAKWEFVKELDGPEELATFTADEAVEAGLADHTFQSMDELLKHYGVTAPAIRLEDSWSESLVLFLTSPPVVGLLIFLALVAGYVEFHTPGFGLPGIAAIVCLSIALGAQYLIGAAQWWELLIIAAGVVLLVIEVLVLPGFGVAGILGLICLVLGTVFAILRQAPDGVPWPSESPLDTEQFLNTGAAAGVAFVLALLAMPLLSRVLPRIPVAGRLIIAESRAAAEPPVPESSPMLRIDVGEEGTVQSVLRPVGKVRFGNDLLDAMSEGDVIEPGTRVRVVRCEGNRLIVEKMS